MDRGAISYWDRLAANWQVPPPMAPAAEDVAWYEERVRDAPRGPGRTGVAALLLGVTPALANMYWPPGTSLVSVDQSSRMLELVLPAGGSALRAQPVRGDWGCLPLPSNSLDIALGDGCYSVLASRGDAERVTREVRRVLRTAGLFCQRCFARPDRPWSVSELYDQLAWGQGLELLRLRLAIAVQGDSPAGVALGDVWSVWSEQLGLLRDIVRRRGWCAETLAGLEAWMAEYWKDSAVRHYFPSRAELCALAADGFELVARDVPRYAWGELFPRIVMRAC